MIFSLGAGCCSCFFLGRGVIKLNDLFVAKDFKCFFEKFEKSDENIWKCDLKLTMRSIELVIILLFPSRI